MRRKGRIFFLSALIISAAGATEGFYKDIFMDGGTGLTHRLRLYAAESLELTLELLAHDDSVLMEHIMVSNPDDANGYLLYPDGAPRFRLLYTNGGDAGRHGRALGSTGRQRIRDFCAGGGSYIGTCAGAYLAALSHQDSGVFPYFYHLWPGRVKPTGITSAATGHFVPPSSPLLNYYHFGGDYYIAQVPHNGGCWANESLDFPPETEILLRYDTLGHRAHRKVSCWAWKGADTSGRIVLTGSHPEGYSYGERLQLMMGMIRYALDGQGVPVLKGLLENGVCRPMNQPTGGDPAFAMIGDRQYHHFACDLPPGCESLSVLLTGADSTQFNLYLRFNGFAFRSLAEYADTTPGNVKLIRIRNPRSGRWFVGVEGATTVEVSGDSFPIYYGRVDVLNGVPYEIVARWGPVALAENPVHFGNISLLSPNPFRVQFSIRLPEAVQEVKIVDGTGRIRARTKDEGLTVTTGYVHWQPARTIAPGVYYLLLQTGTTIKTLRLVYLGSYH